MTIKSIVRKMLGEDVEAGIEALNPTERLRLADTLIEAYAVMSDALTKDIVEMEKALTEANAIIARLLADV